MKSFLILPKDMRAKEACILMECALVLLLFLPTNTLNGKLEMKHSSIYSGETVAFVCLDEKSNKNSHNNNNSKKKKNSLGDVRKCVAFYLFL